MKKATMQKKIQYSNMRADARAIFYIMYNIFRLTKKTLTALTFTTFLVVL